MKTWLTYGSLLVGLVFLGGFQLLADNTKATVPTPEISCLDVQDDGSVIISWINVDNTVLQQNIFYSDDNGANYSRIGFLDTYNPGITSFHHTSADANAGILYYYVEIVYPNGPPVESAPARTMLLLSGEDNHDGIVVLSWNDNLLPGDYTYEIWQAYPIDNWEKRGDVQNYTLYNDVLQDGICDDSVYYRIEVANAAGCRSVSSVLAGKYSGETQAPISSLFDSVSVNSAGEVVLSWTPSISVDAAYTTIYQQIGVAYFPITKVPISDPIQNYTHTTVNPCDNPNLIYAIATEDYCLNITTIQDNRKLSPVYLFEPSYDTCRDEISLRWDPYINAIPPLDEYQILYSLNGDPFTIAGEVDASTTGFTHQQVLPSTTYTYAIRAKFGGITSTSCQKTITTGSYVHPSFLYLANASVLPEGPVEITIDLDLYPNACQWKVWRSEVAGIPQLEYVFDRSEVNTNPFVFIDTTSDGNVEFYDYQLEVIDSCGRSSFYSNLMTTMYLAGTPVTDVINQLNWTPFSGFDAGVKQYNIFRMTDGIVPTQPIATVPIGTTEYVDDLTGVTVPSGITTYWIEAEENPGNSYGYQEKSQSNRVTFAQNFDMFMPNAFRPGGVTPTFKPVFMFFNGQSYLFQVYNRWGQLVFETKNADEGWTGEYQGKDAPMGTYMYRLVYQNFEGNSFEKHGAFTLVR